MKYYTSVEIEEKYENLSDTKKVGVLNLALLYMQQYNGRTVFTCIAMAMGYENYEGEDGTYYKKGKK